MWAFSEEILEAIGDAVNPGQTDRIGVEYLLPGIDVLLMLAVFAATRREAHAGWPVLWGWAWVSVGCSLAVDLGSLALPEGNLLIDLGTSVIYSAILLVLIAAAIGVSPLVVIPRSRRSVKDKEPGGKDEWERFRVALPLLVGTFVAYVTSSLWTQEFERNGVYTGGVDQEYFAQLSQIVPLLLIAVGLEAGLVKLHGPRRRRPTTSTGPLGRGPSRSRLSPAQTG